MERAARSLGAESSVAGPWVADPRGRHRAASGHQPARGVPPVGGQARSARGSGAGRRRLDGEESKRESAGAGTRRSSRWRSTGRGASSPPATVRVRAGTDGKGVAPPAATTAATRRTGSLRQLLSGRPLVAHRARGRGLSRARWRFRRRAVRVRLQEGPTSPVRAWERSATRSRDAPRARGRPSASGTGCCACGGAPSAVAGDRGRGPRAGGSAVSRLA